MSNAFFGILDDEFVLLRQGGVYYQRQLYHRYREGEGVCLYAAHSGGYVRLSDNGATSKPKLCWSELTLHESKYRVRTGGSVILTGDKT